MRKFISLSVLFAAMFAVSCHTYAFTSDEDPSADDAIETIEVTGNLPLHVYYKLRNEKRFAFMDAFNALVDDKDLNFECRKQVPTGSHIKKEVCRNVFDWRIIQEIVREEIIRGNVWDSYGVALMGNMEQRQRKKDLMATINKLLEEDKDFERAYKLFQSADEAYKVAHAQKFGDWSQYQKD